MKYVKKLLFVLCIVAAFLMGACTVGTVNAEQDRPLKIWYHNENGFVQTWNLHDDETGVNYVVVTTERGNGELTVAITPRLNADGSLYVTP